MNCIDTVKPIDTIYNFVDEREYRPLNPGDLKEQFGIGSDEKVIIHVSNFRKIKNLPHIIDAFMKIRERIKVKLLLVGDGPEKHRVMDQVKESPYVNDVLFLGKQENLAELYAISDLKLLLSQQESFGLVLLEAMACGVPCIGSAVGGIPEVIEHGVDGYLVEQGDTDAVAGYAIDLLNDEEKLQSFREAAIRAVSEKFHSSKIVEQYENMYEKVAEKRHAKQ